MLLAITSQKSAIAHEVSLISKATGRLSSRMNHFNQFKQFKILLALIQKHLREIQLIEHYDQQALGNLKIEPYIDASQRIKNHLVRKSREVTQLINDVTLGPYARLARNCLSRISYNLSQIELRMQQALNHPITASQSPKVHQVVE